MLYRQKLGITLLPQFCQSPASLTDFVINVEQLNTNHVTNILLWKPIQKLIQSFPALWVLPVRSLCIRYIQEVKIYHSLHLIFLKEAFERNCVYEALPVVQAQAIPYKLETTQIIDYNFYCFAIYFSLGMYAKAHKKINQVINKLVKQSGKFEQDQTKKRLRLIYVLCYLLFSRNYHSSQIRKQSIYSALGLDSLISNFKQPLPQQKQQLKSLQNLLSYSQGKSFNQIILASAIKQTVEKTKFETLISQLYSFSQIQPQKVSKIALSFKSDRLQRVKTSQIGELKLAEMATMRKLNLSQNIGRYDCKERILYLRYDDQESKIDEMITKCYELNETIKEAKHLKDSQIGFGSRWGSLGGMGMSGLSMFGMRGAF